MNTEFDRSIRVGGDQLAHLSSLNQKVMQPTIVAQTVHYILYGRPLPVIVTEA
jgi:hypothetical protein